MTEVMDVKKLKNKSRNAYVFHLIFIFSLIVFTIAGVFLLIFFSPDNYIWHMVSAMVIACITTFLSFFYFLNIFPIDKYYYRTYKGINSLSLERRRCLTYKGEKEKKTISNVDHRVLEFSYQEKQGLFFDNLYLLDNDFVFEEGKKYRINTFHNIIVECEAFEDATL